MSKHDLSARRAPRCTVSLQLETAPTHCRSLQAWATVDGTSPLTSEESNGKQRGYVFFLCFYSPDLRLKQTTHSGRKSKKRQRVAVQAAVALLGIQVRRMLILTGLYLTMTLIFSLLFGSELKVIAVKQNIVYFMDYKSLWYCII